MCYITFIFCFFILFSVKVTNSVPKKPKLYCPDFIPNLYDSNKFPVNETKNVLSKKNWITPELRNEVVNFFQSKKTLMCQMAIVGTGMLLQGMPQFCFQLIGFSTVTNNLIRLQICFVIHGLLRKLIQESILDVTLVNLFTVTILN